MLLQAKARLPIEQSNKVMHCIKSARCNWGSRICRIKTRIQFTMDSIVVRTEYQIASDFIMAVR